MKEPSEHVQKHFSDQTREDIIEVLRESRRSTLFGDGLEDDYIMDGTTINAPDSDEFGNFGTYEDDLCSRAKLEMGVEEMLQGDDK